MVNECLWLYQKWNKMIQRITSKSSLSSGWICLTRDMFVINTSLSYWSRDEMQAIILYYEIWENKINLLDSAWGDPIFPGGYTVYLEVAPIWAYLMHQRHDFLITALIIWRSDEVKKFRQYIPKDAEWCCTWFGKASNTV